MSSTNPESYGLLISIDDDYCGGWMVTLSDGQVIYQSDEPTSWLKLRDYIYENGLDIYSLDLMFRSHKVRIGPLNSSYFYIRGCYSFLTGGGITYYQHVCGFLENDHHVKVYKYKAPELYVEEEEYRDVSKCEHCLIRRSDNRGQTTKQEVELQV